MTCSSSSCHLPWGIRCPSFIIHSAVFTEHIGVGHYSELSRRDGRWWGICHQKRTKQTLSESLCLWVTFWASSASPLRELFVSANRNWIRTTLLRLKTIPPNRSGFETHILKTNLFSFLKILKYRLWILNGGSECAQNGILPLLTWIPRSQKHGRGVGNKRSLCFS